MTTANGESWSRDPVADANPDLTRKRLRLSEENDLETSPHSSDDSIVIEALPQEPLHAADTINNAIELHHENLAMAPLSDDFPIYNAHFTPTAQLRWLQDRTVKTITPCEFIDLSDCMRAHVFENAIASNNTSNRCECVSSLKDAYLEEQEFFSLLAQVCSTILERHDVLFQTADAKHHRALATFVSATSELTLRMLWLLPDVVDSAISRRDSGQTNKTRHPVGLLAYIRLLRLLLELAGSHPNDAARIKASILRHPDKAYESNPTGELVFIVRVIQKLAYNHREITNSWDAIDDVLRITSILQLDARKEVEQVLEVIHMSIMPAVAEKHPRGLPDGFHATVVEIAHLHLSTIMADADLETAASLYDRYIRADEDALLSEPKDPAGFVESLSVLSEGDHAILEALIVTAWDLQATKQYICSEIMDIRNVGINLLGNLLVKLHQSYQAESNNPEHPVLLFAARFMRANELTKYIFGPKSHASLVNHSQRIIGFLAATSAYTNLETDIIWHACTNSVEVEFVKASFAVLTDLCRYMDLDQLLYLAKKFTTTPPSKLSKDAVDSLTDLFQKIDLKCAQASIQGLHLATAFVSIDILLRIDPADRSPCMLQLRKTAMDELTKFTQMDFNTDDRLEIYDRCLPNIIGCNDRATASTQILAMFLQKPLETGERQALLARLKVSDVVEELDHFLAHHREPAKSASEISLRAIVSRIDLILRLMALSYPHIDEETQGDFFRFAFGESALSNTARDHAWNTLVEMSSRHGLMQVSRSLLNRFLTGEAATLPCHLVTPGLLQLFATSLQQEIVSSSKNFSSVLDTVIWRKLLETAEDMPPSHVSKLAAEHIMTVLFDYPQHGPAKATASQCHAKFARRQLERIFADLESDQIMEEERQDRVVRKIMLLHSVALASKQNAPIYSRFAERDISLTKGSLPTFRSTLQIYGGGQIQPRLLHLEWTDETRLSDLTDALPGTTGASQNRIIVGGQVLDEARDAGKPLAALAITETGVISVCPKHSIHSDLSKVLTSAGTVEREILARYNELERLLDGPEQIAQKVFVFLDQMTPPPQARDRITSPFIDAQTLCPPDHTWRSVYYLRVMYQHLMDFARIGVVDPDFVLHGVRILASILCDESRPTQLELHSRCMDFLTAFLQEQPLDSTNPRIIETPAQLISRLVTICHAAIQKPMDELYARRLLAERSFKLLQQVLRRQPSAWPHFMHDDRILDLHARLLFDNDGPLSATIMTMIKDFCRDADSPIEVVDSYLRTILEILPNALQRPDRAGLFFDLATSTLLQNKCLPTDEARTRELTTSLISTLWEYQHSESVTSTVADTVAAGLLRLLIEAVNIIQSFKKAVNLPGLSTKLYRKLVFPAPEAPGVYALIHPQTRQLALRLVKMTCQTRKDFADLVEATIQPLLRAPTNPCSRFPGRPGWIRQVDQCSGLSNLGMTCYMNSLLQQLFANVHFRKFLFEVPIMDSDKQELLVQVQNLFARMQDFADLATDTSDLARVLGVQTDSQEDVHGFYADFLSRLESNMPDEQSRLSLGRFFTGKLITQIKGECGHVSPRTEPFVDLPIVVKNKTSLHESLQEFVQGEPMEGANQYKCSKCDETGGGRLVNAMRRSCPEEMPDNLTFCLKRFTFESMLGTEGKVNDKFAFPQEIDMSRYCRAYLDDPSALTDEDVFELVGVIVHQGTLQLGHYWSYTLLRNTTKSESRVWTKLEDNFATTCRDGIDEIQRECFGGMRYSNGNERVDNAYVLFYQRKASVEEQLAESRIDLDPTSQVVIPARVAIPQALETMVHTNNVWRHHVAHLFDDDFALFAEWLLKGYSTYCLPPSPVSDEAPSAIETPFNTPMTPSQSRGAESMISCMSIVSAAYLSRIGVCDFNPAKKMKPYIALLKALLNDEPSFAGSILDELCKDPAWIYGVMHSDNKSSRIWSVNFVLHCMSVLRRYDYIHYGRIFGQLRQALRHPLLPGNSVGSIHLEDNLKLIAGLAGMGCEETVAILDDGYWMWVFDLFELYWTPRAKKKHPNSTEWIKKDTLRVSALYDFLITLLNGNVDIPDLSELSPDKGPRTISNNGVALRPEEVSRLVDGVNTLKSPAIPFWFRTSKFAECISGWKESSPGKLLGLLVEGKAPEPLVDSIEKAFLRHIEDEEDSLPSILHLVLHFCTHSSRPGSIRLVWQMLVKVIPMWDSCEGEFLQIIRDAFEAQSIEVVYTLDAWVSSYLNNKSSHIREETHRWLAEDVFKLKDVGVEFEAVDALGTRPSQARRLVNWALPVLEQSYLHGKSRNRSESLIKTLQTVGGYLRALLLEIDERLASDDSAVQETVTTPLRTEHGECLATLRALDDLERVLSKWPLDSPLPNVSQAVEIESDEDLESDDGDDWSGSDMQS